MPKAFISYARADRADVDQLVEHLADLGCETWVDSSLHGGQDWWQVILHRIEDCDVFIAIVSRAALDSVACQREFDWAEALGKPVLPVAVEPLPPALPRRYSRRQVVDYSKATDRDRAARRLGGGLLSLPPAPAPRRPLPRPPDPPLSYLTDLIDLVSARRPISHEQQRYALSRLESALRSVDPEERVGARSVLDRFGGRQDLFADIDRSIRTLVQLDDEARRNASAASGRRTPPAADRPAPPRATNPATNPASGPPRATLTVTPKPPRASANPDAAATPALRGGAALLTLAAVAGATPPIVALGSDYDYPIQIWYVQTLSRALIGLTFVVLATHTKSITAMLMAPIAILQVITELFVISAIASGKPVNHVLPDLVYPTLIGVAALVGVAFGATIFNARRSPWAFALGMWGVCGLVEAVLSYAAKSDARAAPAADTVLLLQNVILLTVAVLLHRAASSKRRNS